MSDNVVEIKMSIQELVQKLRERAIEEEERQRKTPGTDAWKFAEFQQSWPSRTWGNK